MGNHNSQKQKRKNELAKLYKSHIMKGTAQPRASNPQPPSVDCSWWCTGVWLANHNANANGIIELCLAAAARRGTGALPAGMKDSGAEAPGWSWSPAGGGGSGGVTLTYIRPMAVETERAFCEAPSPSRSYDLE